MTVMPLQHVSGHLAELE